jgi:hypothetical protein
MLTARGSRGLALIGRLGIGVTLEQAQAQLDAIADRLARAFPATNLGTLHAPERPRPMTAVIHTRMPPQFRAEIRMASAVMMAAALLVLLTACANVSNLLLTRATTRSREMAIRLALGSSRARLVRQLLVETMLLGAAGAGAGLLVAMWLADALPSFFPPEQARLLAAGVDTRVIAFSLVLAAAASLIFGLAPSLQALRPSAIAARRGTRARVRSAHAFAAASSSCRSRWRSCCSPPQGCSSAACGTRWRPTSGSARDRWCWRRWSCGPACWNSTDARTFTRRSRAFERPRVSSPRRSSPRRR